MGMSLIVSKRFRMISLKASLGILVFFTGIIIYGWLFKGLKDCGCFGSFIKMSPFTSIIKNLILIAMTIVAMIGAKRNAIPEPVAMTYPSRFKTAFIAFCPLLLIGSLGWNYIGKPAKPLSPEITVQASASADDRPFSEFKVQDDSQNMLDLGKDRYLVAFLSDSCNHCQETVSELNEFPKKIDGVPVIGLILGEEDTLRQFREQFLPKFPTALMEPLKFFEFIGDAPPRFYLVQDGKPIKHWDDQLPKIDELKTLIPSTKQNS